MIAFGVSSGIAVTRDKEPRTSRSATGKSDFLIMKRILGGAVREHRRPAVDVANSRPTPNAASSVRFAHNRSVKNFCEVPVAGLLRSVSPNLIVALLMDGPQPKKRWPNRYASVLADDLRDGPIDVHGGTTETVTITGSWDSDGTTSTATAGFDRVAVHGEWFVRIGGDSVVSVWQNGVDWTDHDLGGTLLTCRAVCLMLRSRSTRPSPSTPLCR